VYERDDALKAAMAAVVAEWQATGDQRLHAARIAAGLTQPRREVIIPGFAKRAGIYEGMIGPVSVWGCGDLNEFGLLLRVEAHRDLPLEVCVCVWFPRASKRSPIRP
jgi:hypothetical protein